MSDMNITVNVDEYLAVNKYEVDEGNPHIELVEDPDDAEFDKLIKVCPAALYKRDADGVKSFDYAGCLECGSCAYVCPAHRPLVQNIRRAKAEIRKRKK